MNELQPHEVRIAAWSSAALAALLGLDVALGSDVPLNGSYGLAAVLAATFTTVRVTGGLAAAAVVLSCASGLWNENFLEAEYAIRVVLCTTLCVLAVLLARIRCSREAALRHMTLIADTAQRALLRAVPSEVGPLAVATRYASATQDARVGGDLYEVAASPYGVRVLVGDVRGKGLEAVLLASSVLGEFRRSFFDEPSLVALAVELDSVVAEVGEAEDFVTCLLAEFHPDQTVTLVNLGHHAPLLVTCDGAVDLVRTGDPVPPLGLGPDPQPVTVDWPAGSRMLFYTDGLAEARDRRGAFFDVVGNGSALLRGGLDAALDQLLAALHEHTGATFADDLALLLVQQRTPAPGAQSSAR